MSAKKSKHYWGFDTKSMDRKVRPQDDFYRYANGGWLKSAKIPPEESRWGSFIGLRIETEKQLRAIVNSLLEVKKAPAGSPVQLVRDIYRAAFDMQARNRRGIAPLAPLRMLVRDIKTKKDLLACIAKLHVLGYSVGWGTMVDQDSKNSEKYLLHVWQGGLSLPDRDYYLLDKPEQKRIREAYKTHIGRLLALAKCGDAEIARTKEVVLKVETALAAASMPKQDMWDPKNIYHKMSVAKLQKLCGAVNWPAYLARTGARGVSEVIVGQPEFLKKVDELLGALSIEEWKVYIEWHLINESAGSLGSAFVKENFDFYGTTLTGTKKMRAPWRRALAATGVVGEALGKIYIERYFPQSSKRMMDELVSDLFEVYESRIKNLDWMSAATKRKAVNKLRMVSRKIAYPRKWESYKGLSVDPRDHFGNMLRAEEWGHAYQMRKLRKKVDRDEWHMHPQTVNAYANWSMNEIVFPAAILQWPFFDPAADAAFNYAGIGSVIGHELTHHFDHGGAKFDGKGNMHNWWSAQDKKKFDAKGKLLVEQYNSYKVADEVRVNGELTLGENIADFGGLNIAWDAYQRYMTKHGRKTVANLAPEERFFLSFAQTERELQRPEVAKMYALTDPHSPGFARVNGPLANFAPFYKVFGIKKGDKLYREPSKRAEIW
jgi:putative endopeptidase